MGLQVGLGLGLGETVTGTSRIEEFDLRGGNGGLRVFPGIVGRAVLHIAFNILSEAVRHTAQGQGRRDKRPLLSHFDGAVGPIIGGLGAGAPLPGISGAVSRGDDVFRAVDDLHQVAADEEIEEAVFRILNAALDGVALAETVCHGHLFRTGLKEGGGLAHGLAILLSDHAEVHAPAEGGGSAAADGNGIVPGAGDGGNRQRGGIVVVKGQFVHVRFFLSVALWRVRQAFTKFEFGSTWRSS